MKDFKSYSDEHGGKNADPPKNDYNNTVELAKMITKAMSGKNEGQILHTIISEAERGKRDGSLTNEDLDNFYNTLYPMLDGFKRKKLKEVITRLKNL